LGIEEKIMNLTRKKVVITGAASGTEQQTAKIMKERGATVIGFDRYKSHCRNPMNYRLYWRLLLCH
jgi:NADP-dependent 3-hydroxy acid dehydrogenase YdfG